MSVSREPIEAALLEVLGQRLARADAEALASALPSTLAYHLEDAHHVGEFDLDELTLRLAGRCAVTRADAAARVEAGCRSIAEALAPEALRRLRAALPDTLAALFPDDLAVESSGSRHAQRRHTTIAEGRPGSSRPLSEARPERAQDESVARADNPHADSKLSSATGLLQEREHESLATGHAGSERPLSERR